MPLFESSLHNDNTVKTVHRLIPRNTLTDPITAI